MYRIALCDNSIEDLEQIHDLIVSWQKGHSTLRAAVFFHLKDAFMKA